MLPIQICTFVKVPVFLSLMYKFKINYFAIDLKLSILLVSLLSGGTAWRPAGGALVGAPAVEPRVPPVHRHVLLE